MGTINIANAGRVYFHEYGTGKKPLLAFHGYGMTGKQFDVLENSVLLEYHVYGFDHFFHGGSVLEGWTEADILVGMPKVMITDYVEEWLKIYGKQRFSVMGFSIGARLALILTEEYPDLIDDIILMSPDGLSVHKGFHFLTNNAIGRSIFSRMTKSKWMATSLLKTLNKAGIIDNNLYQIAHSETDTPKKRLDVYCTLNLLHRVIPDVEKVAALVNEYHIKCILIFGRHDRLFPATAALPFINLLNNPQVHEPPLQHYLVLPALDEYLVSLANDTRTQKQLSE
jgi:pimeloyl-ACP methyl ester carboxylesterase